MTDKLELILIFFSVLFGVVSASYFYFATGIFMRSLAKPLKMVAIGMFVIAVGVLMSAFITYESGQGVEIYLLGYPLTAFFYLFYLVGSLIIAFGASRFTKRPKPVASAV